MMRAHCAVFVVAMLVLVLAAILTGIGCWQVSSRLIKGAGALNALAGRWPTTAVRAPYTETIESYAKGD